MSIIEDLKQAVDHMSKGGAKLIELKISPTMMGDLLEELDGRSAKEVIGVDVVADKGLTIQ